MLYNLLTSTIATDTRGSGEHYLNFIFEYQLTVLCTPSVPQRGLRAMNNEGISYNFEYQLKALCTHTRPKLTQCPTERLEDNES